MTARTHATDDLLSALEVCAQTGASYRQLDYWTREGLVRTVVAVKGSGNVRWFSPNEARVAATIARVTGAVTTRGCPAPLELVRRHIDEIRHALHSGARWMVLTPERAHLEAVPHPLECGWFVALVDDLAEVAA